ncbi:MAG: GC-type dockerin domain-anchored protein [Phycisphaerales bacterium]
MRRWIVPETAVYRVTGLFGDYTPDFGTGIHDGVLGEIRLPGLVLWSLSTTGTTADAPYQVEHAMPMGATLEFAVSPKASQHNDRFTFTAMIEVARACVPDVTATANPFVAGFGEPDGVLSNEDFFYYLLLFSASDPLADWTHAASPGSVGYGIPNGVLNNEDFFYDLSLFAAGC